MKIAIVGSREFKNTYFARSVIADLLRQQPKVILVSGGARGIDSLAEEVANTLEREIIVFPADWDKYGKRAGFIRNQLIIDAVDKVIAFWDGKSKGTKHSIDLAIKARKPLDIYVR